MTNEEIKKAWRFFVTQTYTNKPCDIGKTVFENTVAAVEAWVQANQASYVAALPNNFKNNTNATEKVNMLIAVLLAMQGKL